MWLVTSLFLMLFATLYVDHKQIKCDKQCKEYQLQYKAFLIASYCLFGITVLSVIMPINEIFGLGYFVLLVLCTILGHNLLKLNNVKINKLKKSKESPWKI